MDYVSKERLDADYFLYINMKALKYYKAIKFLGFEIMAFWKCIISPSMDVRQLFQLSKSFSNHLFQVKEMFGQLD